MIARPLRREPVPFKEQLVRNPVSAVVILLSIVALVSLFSAILFKSPITALTFVLIVNFKLPMIGLVIAGAFVDKSRWWLLGATLAYLSCFLVPSLVGLKALQRIVS
ncbi:MAG: hypothetical protein AAF581_09715 [Planctomycetota bacterium]